MPQSLRPSIFDLSTFCKISKRIKKCKFGKYMSDKSKSRLLKVSGIDELNIKCEYFTITFHILYCSTTPKNRVELILYQFIFNLLADIRTINVSKNARDIGVWTDDVTLTYCIGTMMDLTFITLMPT